MRNIELIVRPDMRYAATPVGAQRITGLPTSYSRAKSSRADDIASMTNVFPVPPTPSKLTSNWGGERRSRYAVKWFTTRSYNNRCFAWRVLDTVLDALAL